MDVLTKRDAFEYLFELAGESCGNSGEDLSYLDVERRERVVLSIDDEEDITHGIALRLAGSGYDVRSAKHGMDGYRMAFSLHPTAILLDYNMPFVNGEQVFLGLRENPLVATIPVILISGKVDDRTEARLLKMGAFAVLHKPIEFERLVLLLDEISGGDPRPSATNRKN
ncbi:response regulator [Rhodopirellula islandica]|nr:response regulator [Rhodopirellula islandica]